MTYSLLANPSATRDVLDRHGLSAKHYLGQNFLIDDNVIGHILELAGLRDAGALGAAGSAFAAMPAPAAAPVPEPAAKPAAAPTPLLEIGPGIGTLTVALLEHAPVVAVERDDDLVAILAQTTSGAPHAFELVHADALKLGAEQLREACGNIGEKYPTQLVANLPYNIAATVVLDWLQRFEFLDSMTVMVQSEVADRMAAVPGGKEYGAYTVKLNLLARVTARFQVPPSCFFPAPHVSSAVVHIERNQRSNVDAQLVARACELAEAAFAQRRKTIRNSMSSRMDKQLVDALLEACGIVPNVRGETLSVETYLQMARVLQQLA